MNNPDATRILLVEGVAGIGKSTLIGSLIRKYAEDNRRVRSLLNLTQAHTYFPLEPDAVDNALTAQRNLAHLEQILNLLGWLASTVSYETRKIFVSTIDTLHITHCFRPGILSWNDVAEFDSSMARLGCKLVFLRAGSRTIWDRTIWDRRDNQFITLYGKKYGGDLEAIHEYFVNEQEAMLTAVGQSKMKKLIIDCDKPVSDIVEDVYSYWLG